MKALIESRSWVAASAAPGDWTGSTLKDLGSNCLRRWHCQNTRHCIHHPIDVSLGGAPVSYADAHGATATPGRAAKERCAGFHYRGNYFVGAAIVIITGCPGFWRQKPHQALIDCRLP